MPRPRSPAASDTAWLIAQHASLKSLYDLRLVALLVVTVVMFGVAGVIGGLSLRAERDDRSRLAAAAWQRSSLDAAVVVRPVNRLRFIHADVDDELPSYLVVSPELVDYADEDMELRRLAPPAPELDWTFVLTFVVGITCLLICFDSVSGERQKGTLRLLFAAGVSRSSYYWGSFLGALLTTVPFVAVGVVVNLICVSLLARIQLDSGELVRVALCFLAAVLLVVAFLALGLFATCVASRPATSLLVGLCAWITVSFVIPYGGLLLAPALSPTPSVAETEARLRQAQTTFFRQLYPISSTSIRKIVERTDLSAADKRERLERLQRTIDEQDQLALQAYRRAVVEIRSEVLNSLRQQVQLARSAQRISPVAAYSEAVAALVGSGLSGQEDFVRQAQDYRLVFRDYAGQMRRALAGRVERQGIIIEEGGFEIRNTHRTSFATVAFERDSFPRFSVSRPSIAEDLAEAVPALWFIATVTLLALGSGYLVFAFRQDD